MSKSCNVANIVSANWNYGYHNDGALVKAAVVSTPNGQKYGVPGHIPCDHAVVCHYERAVRSFDGTRWSLISRS